MELHVWWISNPPRQPFYFPVGSPKEAVTVLEALSQYDLYLGDFIEANAGGLIDDFDEEWESPDGQNIWDWKHLIR